MPTFHQILSRVSSIRRKKPQQRQPHEKDSPRASEEEDSALPGAGDIDQGLSPATTFAPPPPPTTLPPAPVPVLSMSDNSTPSITTAAAAAVEPSSATTPPASPCPLPPTVGQERIDVDHLEFAASRDLALLLGTSWDSQKKPLADLSLLAGATALPPSPQENDSNNSKDRIFRTLPKKHRLSLYRPKSFTALKRSKSIPNVIRPRPETQEAQVSQPC
ncbi:hypothetical protein BCR43DRAFT_222278 [Syncephalastrum racemosum]|uniref:Uncharacterized protein n=1 Tax=Syncephalastrum racemosum TaxID=13706 RepID=A0A1X2HJH7_SYNRA|nr:hypothetical protein BCR43DRAFT_222278 [Syncephalastrum racemosum]